MAAQVRSAGILLWRPGPDPDQGSDVIEVYIAHMGGPFWAKKDAGAWSIPKGIIDPDEDELAAAIREFGEEIGTAPPAHDYLRLGEFRQKSGKVVIAFAAESDFDTDEVRSNLFEMEWPPRSGRIQQFPEIDGAAWLPLPEARAKLSTGQHAILDALEVHVHDR